MSTSAAHSEHDEFQDELLDKLVADIYALQERGYTLAWVAEILTGFGVEVTEALLRSCLDRRRNRRDSELSIRIVSVTSTINREYPS